MSVTPSGYDGRSSRRWVRDAIELVSSMRFSISLLTVICVASVIGTVITQHEPYGNYVNQFGPFWAELFSRVGLFTVYSVWWFLLILAFLVASTSLCIARNLPRIWVELRSDKVHLREQSLASFHHHGTSVVTEPPSQALARIDRLLTHAGWRTKVQERAGGTMVAARRGAAHKIGYLAAHSAIVLVCLGGLLDGDLIVRLQMMLQGKSSYAGGGAMRDVPERFRLGPGTPTFRAHLLVPEGARSGTAVISMQDGVVLQDLPFDIELKKFIVEYFQTGMPKLFASDIVIHDRATGEAIPVTVKVNAPAFHRGVAIYQSSFDDGGSSLQLKAIPMTPGGRPFEISGVVGGSTRISDGNASMTLEFSGLRVINVEDLGASLSDGSADVRTVDLAGALAEHLGAAVKAGPKKELHNVGPSVSYKLRDASGQAREFNNYMLPVDLDGQRVFLAGARAHPDEAFRYLRIPADDQDHIDGWARLRAGLLDPAKRRRAAARYVASAAPPGKPELAAQLTTTAIKALALFAGAEPSGQDDRNGSERAPGGLASLSEFIESSVPEPDRPRIAEVLLRILDGSLFEMLNLTREDAGLPALTPSPSTRAFMTQSVLSLSDSFLYPAPALFELSDFKQVQASVFQVARAPGRTLFNVGAVLLIIGVCAMLCIRERRLWVWLVHADGGTRITTALSTTRRTLDADAEFDHLKARILTLS